MQLILQRRQGGAASPVLASLAPLPLQAEEGEVEQAPPGSEALQERCEPELVGGRPRDRELGVEYSAEELASGGWRTTLGRQATAAAARASGLLRDGAVGRALPAVLATLLVVGAVAGARRARTSWRRPDPLLVHVRGELESAAAARDQLHAGLTLVQQRVQEVSNKLEALASGHEALQQSCCASASAAVAAAADLAQLRGELEVLQQAAAAEAPAPGNRHIQPALSADMVQQAVREQVSEALERFAADRTGLPDYALAAGGAAVVSHSPAHLPPSAAATAGLAGVLPKRGRVGLHPHATKVTCKPCSLCCANLATM